MKKLSILLTCFVILTTGCPSSQTSMKAEPDWIDQSGKRDGYYYEIGHSSKAKDVLEARKLAIADGKVKLSQYVYSKVESIVENIRETVSKGYQDIKREKRLIKDVIIESSAELQNVDVVKDHKTKNAEGVYRYYVLLRIPVDVLEKEREQFANRIAEKLASVDQNLVEGQTLLDQGRLSEGLGKLIMAAFNSTRVPQRQHEFNNIVNMIKDTLGRVSFRKFNDRQTGTKSNGLSKPLKILVQYTHRSKGKIPAIDTKLRFLMKKNAGSDYDQYVVTNNSGIAQCQIRSIRRSQKTDVVVYINVDAQLDEFSKLRDPKWRSKRYQIQEMFDRRAITRFTINVR